MRTEHPIKLKNKFSPSEVYYTYAHWPQKEIDGVPFMPVVKSTPSQTNTQTVHFMRKDSLEKVK